MHALYFRILANKVSFGAQLNWGLGFHFRGLIFKSQLGHNLVDPFVCDDSPKLDAFLNQLFKIFDWVVIVNFLFEEFEIVIDF